MTFIGREKETLLMQQALEQEQATILLYGKRKVGKTTLIKGAEKCLSSSWDTGTALSAETKKSAAISSTVLPAAVPAERYSFI